MVAALHAKGLRVVLDVVHGLEPCTRQLIQQKISNSREMKKAERRSSRNKKNRLPHGLKSWADEDGTWCPDCLAPYFPYWSP